MPTTGTDCAGQSIKHGYAGYVDDGEEASMSETHVESLIPDAIDFSSVAEHHVLMLQLLSPVASNILYSWPSASTDPLSSLLL